MYGAPLEIVESIQVMFVGSVDQVRSDVDLYVAAGALLPRSVAA